MNYVFEATVGYLFRRPCTWLRRYEKEGVDGLIADIDHALR